jgi:EF hand
MSLRSDPLKQPRHCAFRSDVRTQLRAHFVAFAGAAIVALSLPTMAAAQVSATDEYLARMDSDQDGRIALGEYQAWMSYAFEGMDRNHDGILTPDELPGGRGPPISLVEHRDTLAERFRRQDTDRDGFLNAQELVAPPR